MEIENGGQTNNAIRRSSSVVRPTAPGTTRP
jgi:hypothetical protein